MKKKRKLTIVERAKQNVPGFVEVSEKLEQQVVLRGQSKSTLTQLENKIT